MIDQEAYREKYGTLEKIFKDPYDVKTVKWIAIIGIPTLIIEVYSIILLLGTHDHPFEELMNSGRTYFRMGALAFGFWSCLFLWRMRKNRRKYGEGIGVLDTELSNYGEAKELRSRINRELTSPKAILMDRYAITENWLISFAYIGYPAKVVPLNKIRYVGKFLHDSSPCLIFFDEEINELTMVSMKENLLEELAVRLQRIVPQMEFYGHYLFAYNAKAAKFHIKDAKLHPAGTEAQKSAR